MVKPSVLIIGQDSGLRGRLLRRLQLAGCEVLTADDGRRGIERAVEAAPDIVMLGLDLPDADCLEVCRSIRNRLEPGRSPVFLLTPGDRASSEGMSGNMDSVRGGKVVNHVDYGCSALLAWLQAAAGSGDHVIASQGSVLDRRRHRATVDGRMVELTATEYRLLWTLADEPGKVFDRQTLARVCSVSGHTRVRTVGGHIKAIRTKLGERADLVETVHRLGYRFRLPAVAEPPRIPVAVGTNEDRAGTP
jgi:two-component system phosphate regulon response regulator PhoB